MTDEHRHRQNIAYCCEQVQKQAGDLFLAARFAPESRHDALMAIYAFACEINRIPASVSESPLGAIRQQWWREALEEALSGEAPRAHPVVEALAVTADGRHAEKLRQYFSAAIDGIGVFLYQDDFQSIEQVLDTTEVTHGYAAGLGALVLDPDAVVSAQKLKAIIRLESLAAIGRALESGAVPATRHGTMGGIELFADRLARFAAANWQELPDDLLGQFQEAARELGIVETDIMPAVAQTALLPGYVKRALVSGPNGGNLTRPFAPIGKRINLFRAVLSGRL